MNVLILLVFVGIMVVTLALVLFAWTLRGGTFDHSDRLALLPLADDAPPVARRAKSAPAPAETAENAAESLGTPLVMDACAQELIAGPMAATDSIAGAPDPTAPDPTAPDPAAPNLTDSAEST